ncbi:2Fe-2S iron-sulfur cluster-binding protein [Kitasatospora sp. NPDC056327]|uniref:2Fe-2S iron-sulfur cluster-binding protein n=1 Tax=Kitasatospora sp. NPDC056327 TaxID=3345785 RepID=UPI0035DFEDEC
MSPSPPTAARQPGWHRLRVAGVDRLTDDAVAIRLDPPDGPGGTALRYRPGQHVVVRHRAPDGAELRRSYSLCPPPDAPDRLRLVVRRLGPGGFADHAGSALTTGDLLELSTPVGGFGLDPEPGRHHVMIAGGSGVTPLLAMAAHALRTDPRARVSLVHAVPTARAALLADELADLKDGHLRRFTALHVLSRERRESDLLSGRIDGRRLSGLLELLGAAPGDACTFYLCGPGGLVRDLHAALLRRGAEPGRIRTEFFTSADAPEGPGGPDAPAAPDAPAGPDGPDAAPADRLLTVRLSGRTSTVTLRPTDRSVLDAVLRARPETPYSCRDGICGACRARVVGGRLVMDRHHALGDDEVSRGAVLTCRARPAPGTTDGIALDFDL